MEEKMMQALCEEDGFTVQGSNKKELVETLKMHVKKMHGMAITNKEAEERMCMC